MKKNQKTVLIPSMLDFHFPLLQYAFCSKKYKAVILDEKEGIIETGLYYAHNDLCYPCVLIIGQMINALNSGKYDLDNTILLIPQAGDACRGSNYIHMIRSALKKAGYGKIPIISLNFKGLEEENMLSINPLMVMKAVAAIMYSDMLMILKNQIAPYEIKKGETQNIVDKWISYLENKIQKGKAVSYFSIKKNLKRIANDFKYIEKENRNIKKVGIVGELYVKYCSLGNSNIESFLSEENCEYMVNGFSWYMIYYIDTHLTEENKLMGLLYKIALKYLSSLQERIVENIRNAGFVCISEFQQFKNNAKDKISFGLKVADGWLISCEIINLIKESYKKIVCIQPFGCMPNHVCGKGMYAYLKRQYPDVNIVSVDYDSSGSEINVKNRIKMLIDI